MSETQPSLEFESRSDGFGAVVRGVDLSKSLSRETAGEIRENWSKRGVLVFPDQCLEPSELEAFTLSLGEFGVDHFIESMEGHENILELRREPD